MFLITTLFLFLSGITLTVEPTVRSSVNTYENRKAVRRVVISEGPGSKPRCNISAESSSSKAQPEC